MKKFASVIVFIVTCLMMVCFSVTSFAEETSEQIEAVFEWEVLDETAKTAKINSVNTDVTGELVIPETIEGYTVSSLASYAFRDCTAITSVVFEADIKALPSGLFHSCTALTEFVAPTITESIGTYTFYGCTSLENVVLNEGLLSIGHNAFGGCTSLKNIVIPSTVNKISTRVFYKCSSLEKIEVAQGNTHYVADSAGALYPSDYSTMLQYPYASAVETYKIADGVTAIANGDFTGCNNLKTLIIPDSVTSIGMNTFKDSTLENVVIGAGVTSVGNYAFSASALKTVEINAVTDNWGDYVFYNCVSLETVTFNSETKVIPKSIFNGCTALESVTGLSGVEQIENYAFRNCSVLTSVDVGANVQKIYDNAFWGCSALTVFPFSEKTTYIGQAAFMLCESLSGELVIPESLTTLGVQAFLGCSGITSVDIPDSLSSLPQSAFSSCKGIKNLVIPGNIKTIGTNCFSGVGLDSLVLSEGVEKIESLAFDDCGLEDIVLPSTIKFIGNNAFQNHYDSEIIIPEGVEEIGSMAFNGKVAYTVYVYSDDCIYNENNCPFNKNSTYSTITVYGYKGSTTENYIANCPTLSGEYHNHVYYDMCADAGLHQPLEVCADITTCRYCLETISGHTDDDSDNLCDICGMTAELPVYTPDCSLSFSNGVLTVSGTSIVSGDYEDLLSEYAPVTESIMFNNGFEAVGEGVFADYSALKFIYIPSSMTSIGADAFADSNSIRSIVTFSDNLSVSATAFPEDSSFNLFVKSDAAVSGIDSLNNINIIHYTFNDTVLEFDGSLKSDLYDLFDVTTMFSLVYENIMTLHFEYFEAVDFSVFAYNTEDYSAIDKTVFENVDFTLHAFVDGEYAQISFYQLYLMSSEGYEGTFYLTTSTDEDSIVHDDTQISIADQFSQAMERILSAIVRLFNKIFAFFSKLGR